MPAGVRVTLRTDSSSLVCRYQADPAPTLNGPGERARIDVVCDGRRADTVKLETHGGDAGFRCEGLPGRMAAPGH
ncbi:hypothetical protein JK364_04220 [Streptomyces sp. 110]|uniref:SsfX3-like N-terminal domain-containing protein n=1 Tax=Streptomyces endocoffeicus TaxID=2898945 RepID=A0ABS1PGZ9_9ACTN|nr:hypothetical protein [Streptomyces endocoffeicus]MBL1111623.1 hypothetical protein [Streptomyces endocoffeicus]